MVSVVLVLHYPNRQAVEALLADALPQVGLIVAVDNTPATEPDRVISLDRFAPSVIHVKLDENLGIAFAQNVGIRKSAQKGATHVLLLDQDSRIPKDMVNVLLSAETDLIADGVQVAAVGPVFIDSKTNEVCAAPRRALLRTEKIIVRPNIDGPTRADYLIASGSLIRIEIFDKVGLMLEELFIDWVDIEWGLRARHYGFDCYMIPAAVMIHSVGNAVVRVLGRNLYLHNPLRGYYRIRNAILLLRRPYINLAWKLNIITKVPKFVLLFSCCSPQQLRSARLSLRACIDGIRGRTGKYSVR